MITTIEPKTLSQPDLAADPGFYWHSEFPLGGSANQLAIGQNADGRLELFYAGTSNHLYHNWQIEPNSLFWFGETPFSGDSALQIAVARNADGRLEIFYVGTNNDLYHNWQTAPGSTTWAGETPFKGVKANEVQVARNADGRLEVFYRGTANHLYHNWQTAPGSAVWKGETAFSGDSALQMAVAQNADGRLEIFYVGTNHDLYHNWQTAANSTTWKGETPFANAKANEVEASQNQDGRLEIFYRGTGNDLYHNWQTAPNSTSWNGETPFASDSAKQLAVGQNAEGGLEIFYVGTNNDLYRNWQTAANSTTWAGETPFANSSANEVVVGKNADGRLEIFYRGTENHLSHRWQRPDPGTGFGGNSNYILYNNCSNITGLTVKIDVTQDIVCQANNGSISGFSFQLNAYSPKKEKSAWQQYIMVLDGKELIATIDNWPLTGDNLINDQSDILSIPSERIPAGYQLSIALQNDKQGNITGATYQVLDADGNSLANLTKTLTSHGASDLAPIIAFELNLVGPFNGEAALLSSGAGIFVYQADTTLTALTNEPPCAESSYFTDETANSVYGPVSALNGLFTQTFNVTTNEAEIVHKVGKSRPPLVRRSAARQ
jgi:hypothetical protein